jgi:hypothetical protein
MQQRAQPRWRRRSPLERQLQVQWDADGVKVSVIQGLDARWNQSFRWDCVRTVCFEDGAGFGPDVVYVCLNDPEILVVVPTAARGGTQFLVELCERGLFPERVWRRGASATDAAPEGWTDDHVDRRKVSRAASRP